MRIANNSFIDTSVDASKAWNSKALYLAHIYMSSIQIVYTGAINGKIKLQASNDEGEIMAGSQATIQSKVVNWTDIKDSEITITSAGNTMYNLEQQAYRWLRIVFTPDEGGSTGNITVARFNLKGV